MYSWKPVKRQSLRRLVSLLCFSSADSKRDFNFLYVAVVPYAQTL